MVVVRGLRPQRWHPLTAITTKPFCIFRRRIMVGVTGGVIWDAVLPLGLAQEARTWAAKLAPIARKAGVPESGERRHPRLSLGMATFECASMGGLHAETCCTAT